MQSPTILRAKVGLAAKLELERRRRRQERSERLRVNLRDFIKEAWLVVEPAKPLVHNWHIDAIADHLQAIADGDIRFLLINIGPGYAKSLIASVCFSAWLWTRDPQIRILAGTYASNLTVRDNIRTRTLIESQWYQDTFVKTLPVDGRWRLTKRLEDFLQNDKTGVRVALSVDGLGTGLRGDGQIIDDAISASESRSQASRERAKRWINETMSSRFDDMRKGWRVAIGQRLHEEDPYGDMLATGVYTHLCLPTEFEPKRRSVTSIGFADPRTEYGELLFPELFNEKVVAQAKLDLGSYGYSGQHQQLPAPAEGGMFKRSWWKYWKPKGSNLPDVPVQTSDGNWTTVQCVEIPDSLTEIQSWDCTFKDTKTSDFVVGQNWAYRGASFFLTDQVKGRWDFPATVKEFKSLRFRHPRCHTSLVEDKANGSAVISTLKTEIAGIIPVNPEGGKEARAAAVSPIVEAGNVYLPHPQIAPWVGDFIEETASFPSAIHDDQVDSATQALIRMSTKQVYISVV